MTTNPMIRPAVASAPLIVATAVIGPCLIYAVAATVANWPAPMWLVITAAMLLADALILVFLWTRRFRRCHQWDLDAQLKWQELGRVKAASMTTTEVAIVSINEVQPTGAWATINWNRFGHVQQAWLEAGPFEFWSGSVMLITPDPCQVQVGTPWPPIYCVHSGDCRAVAPAI